MKTQATKPEISTGEHSEFLILPDGKILAHNITAAMAKILSELNPDDVAMHRRANQKDNLKHELPN
jgi:hypothetical protein